MNRRELIDTMMKAGAGIALAPVLAHAAEPSVAGGATRVLEQELPGVTTKGWQMTALEVVYAPGETDRAHKHPGFVFGYVLEGEIRFRVDGGEEVTYRAGQMFYEPPGSVHRVSANASSARPARLLAMIFAEKGATLLTPA